MLSIRVSVRVCIIVVNGNSVSGRDVIVKESLRVRDGRSANLAVRWRGGRRSDWDLNPRYMALASEHLTTTAVRVLMFHDVFWQSFFPSLSAVALGSTLA